MKNVHVYIIPIKVWTILYCPLTFFNNRIYNNEGWFYCPIAVASD